MANLEVEPGIDGQTDANGLTASPPEAVWRVAPGDPAAERRLMDEFEMSPLIARMLVNRGVRSPEDVSPFLNPSRSQLFRPHLFSQMEKAVARIRRAIDAKEKIFIFGDRDVDGVSGTAILRIALQAFGASVDSHIPLGGEGYGVHPDVMGRALADGYTLGITVDTGICEIDRVAEANAGGMDVIIADHHQHKETIPAACAILHPGIPGEPYPFKHLSGAGVAFKLAMALFASKSPYADRPLVFLDVETTGLSKDVHEVIEIGAVKYRNGVKTAEFSRLLKPSGPIPDEIRRITGITNELLGEQGLDRRETLRNFQEFIAEPGTILVGYNVGFDRGFLAAELARNLNVKLEHPVEDVMTLALTSLPGLSSRTLGGVAAELEIELTDAHRALPDAQAAADIFYHLLDRQDVEQNLFYDRFIPLAALAAVADMMPLTGENRAIVAEGLRLLKDSPPLGLKKLLERLELPAPNGKDLAFLLGPLLNAPGRLGDARPALNLLTVSDSKAAEKLAEDLVRMNEERKALVKNNFGRLNDLVPLQNDLARDRILCLSVEGVPHGVTGIIASRIKNAYGRPIMIILVEDGMGVGTGRSVESLNLLEVVDPCADLLVKYGGHHQAVGVTVHPDNIPAFFERLKKETAARLHVMPQPSIDIEAELSAESLTIETLEDIAILEPFGKGNPFPKFGLFDAPLAEVRRMGDAQQHLRLKIGKDARRGVTAVGWSMGARADDLRGRIDAVFELSKNEWRGRTDLQLVLEDIRLSKGATVS
ncbi:single-stranded-DNA-specific exonuclease RecJ [bacterium]|nr:single-stranded-DNA-specific exonuclease RecJ [bacterium]